MCDNLIKLFASTLAHIDSIKFFYVSSENIFFCLRGIVSKHSNRTTQFLQWLIDSIDNVFVFLLFDRMRWVDSEGQKLALRHQKTTKSAQRSSLVSGEFMATTPGSASVFSSTTKSKRKLWNWVWSLNDTLRSSCICGNGRKCTKAEDNLSMGAFVYRCMPENPTTTPESTD